ncbi:MAG: M23 family metallopeptidase, partial [Pseudonocardiaceae bacterium]
MVAAPPETLGADLSALAKGEQIASARAARAAEEKVAADRDAAARALEDQRGAAGRAVAPVSGRITSNYGPRWGDTHYGLDVANSIGTPIVTSMDGLVINSGPASGFGLWVRVQHDDGTITVYGHIDETLVDVGQRVAA